MLSFLRREGVSEDIVAGIEAFRAEHRVSPEAEHRLTQKPRYEYYGKEVWEAAATALLCGENLLLVGPKATGKTFWPSVWPAPSGGRAGTCLSI